MTVNPGSSERHRVKALTPGPKRSEIWPQEKHRVLYSLMQAAVSRFVEK
jgi:hypothetical protein